MQQQGRGLALQEEHFGEKHLQNHVRDCCLFPLCRTSWSISDDMGMLTSTYVTQTGAAGSQTCWTNEQWSTSFPHCPGRKVTLENSHEIAMPTDCGLLMSWRSGLGTTHYLGESRMLVSADTEDKSSVWAQVIRCSGWHISHQFGIRSWKFVTEALMLP